MKAILKKFLYSSLLFFATWIISSPNVFALEKQISGAFITTNGNVVQDERRINIISQVLGSIYFPFSYSGLSIFLDKNQIEPRGQITGGNMKLSGMVLRDAEFIQLFTHELGHFVDIMLLRETANTADPSKNFYKISWREPKVKNPSAKMSDFVSGYSATNQYEDFAEAFVWYIFHNENFVEKALKNDNLRQKYLFFSDYIFVHGEFQ